MTTRNTAKTKQTKQNKTRQPNPNEQNNTKSIERHKNGGLGSQNLRSRVVWGAKTEGQGVLEWQNRSSAELGVDPGAKQKKNLPVLKDIKHNNNNNNKTRTGIEKMVVYIRNDEITVTKSRK